MLKTLIVISLLSLAVSKAPFECSEAGLYQCPKSATCCKTNDESGNSGFKCFPIVDGTCCEASSIIGVCPENTVCDTKKNRCSYSAVRLLQAEEYAEFVPISNSFEPSKVLLSSSLAAVDSGKLIDGFFEGIAIFKEVEICKPSDDHINPLVLEITDLMKAIVKIDNISKIKAAMDKVNSIFKTFENTILSIAKDCAKSKESIKKFISDLDEKLDSWTYAPKLVHHSVVECFNIVRKAKDLASMWSSSDDFSNGKRVGELVKFLLFWDL